MHHSNESKHTLIAAVIIVTVFGILGFILLVSEAEAAPAARTPGIMVRTTPTASTNLIYYVDSAEIRHFIGNSNADNGGVCLPEAKAFDQLQFEIDVYGSWGAYTETTWRMGNGGRNADGQTHAVTKWQGGDLLVQFEDSLNTRWHTAAEPDYADAIFEIYPADCG